MHTNTLVRLVTISSTVLLCFAAILTINAATAAPNSNTTATTAEPTPSPLSTAETAAKTTAPLNPMDANAVTTLSYVPGSIGSVDIKDDDITSTVSNDDDEEEDEDDDEPRFTMETFVTIFVTLFVVLSNCTIIIVAAWTEAFHNFNKVFIYSMSLADLLMGLFVTPYSIFLSVYRRWVFASGTFCNIEAYVLLTLNGAKLFSLTWLNVDHYIAVRKPERYNVMMSKTRSVCWIIISWMAAICFFMPPMLSFKSSLFNRSIFLCQADTKDQIPYILTSVILVSMPALLALFITNVYLFTKSYKKRIRFYEKVFVELSTRPWNYHTTFVMCAVEAGVWVPYGILQFVNHFSGVTVHDRAEFYLCWLGFCSSFSNFFVLLFMCGAFRHAVLEMYSLFDWCPTWCCCCRKQRHHYSSDVNVITLTRKR